MSEYAYTSSTQSSKDNIDNFIVNKKLGEGSFSDVFQVTRKSDSTVYAMKKVKLQKLSPKEKENALNEVRILASIEHPNVIGYKEAFFEDSTNSLCIVMEHADGGDVLQLIQQKKKEQSKLSEATVWHYFIQIVRGLKALHDLKICHRDIKCANLFMTKKGVVKLGDLNVSKIQKYGMLRTQTGTPYYACPEVWKDMPYDHRSDIWSLGCVLYEMATNLPPFRAPNMKGLYTKVISGRYVPMKSELYSQDLREVIAACLQTQSSKRPSCDQILSMPQVQNNMTDKLKSQMDNLCEEQQLIKTIRMPKSRGMITERMPASKYSPRRIIQSSHNNEVEKIGQPPGTSCSGLNSRRKSSVSSVGYKNNLQNNRKSVASAAGLKRVASQPPCSMSRKIAEICDKLDKEQEPPIKEQKPQVKQQKAPIKEQKPQAKEQKPQVKEDPVSLILASQKAKIEASAAEAVKAYKEASNVAKKLFETSNQDDEEVGLSPTFGTQEPEPETKAEPVTEKATQKSQSQKLESLKGKKVQELQKAQQIQELTPQTLQQKLIDKSRVPKQQQQQLDMQKPNLLQNRASSLPQFQQPGSAPKTSKKTQALLQNNNKQGIKVNALPIIEEKLEDCQKTLIEKKDIQFVKKVNTEQVNPPPICEQKAINIKNLRVQRKQHQLAPLPSEPIVSKKAIDLANRIPDVPMPQVSVESSLSPRADKDYKLEDLVTNHYMHIPSNSGYNAPAMQPKSAQAKQLYRDFVNQVSANYCFNDHQQSQPKIDHSSGKYRIQGILHESFTPVKKVNLSKINSQIDKAINLTNQLGVNNDVVNGGMQSSAASRNIDEIPTLHPSQINRKSSLDSHLKFDSAALPNIKNQASHVPKPISAQRVLNQQNYQRSQANQSPPLLMNNEVKRSDSAQSGSKVAEVALTPMQRKLCPLPVHLTKGQKQPVNDADHFELPKKPLSIQRQLEILRGENQKLTDEVESNKLSKLVEHRQDRLKQQNHVRKVPRQLSPNIEDLDEIRSSQAGNAAVSILTENKLELMQNKNQSAIRRALKQSTDLQTQTNELNYQALKNYQPNSARQSNEVGTSPALSVGKQNKYMQNELGYGLQDQKKRREYHVSQSCNDRLGLVNQGCGDSDNFIAKLKLREIRQVL